MVPERSNTIAREPVVPWSRARTNDIAVPFYRISPNCIAASSSRRPRESGDPVAFIQKTLDSLPAFAGTKGRGNDDGFIRAIVRFGHGNRSRIVVWHASAA